MKKKKKHGGRREGAGRPRQFDQSVVLSVVVDSYTHERLVRLAEIQDTTRSVIVRTAILQYLSRNL